jgi:hypothetical protein
VEHGFAVSFEVFAEAEEIAGFFQELGEESFAIDEGKAAQIVAVEVKQIEGKVGDRLFDAFLKGGLQVSEAGRAVFG